MSRKPGKADAGPRQARGRFVSRSIAASEQLASVSLLADYLFRSCIPFLDVAGRMTGNPALVKSQVVPLRDEINSRNLPELLRELARAVDHDGIPLVFWYEISGARVLEFPGFSKHQQGLRVDREASSKFPPRNGKELLLHLDGATPDALRTNSGVSPAQEEGKGRECEGEEEVEKRVVVLASAYALELAIAANRGLAEHPNKPQRIPRIMPTAGRTLEAAQELLDAKIPLEFAQAEVYRTATSHDAEGEIASLRYFVQPVLRAWLQRSAKNASDQWIPPSMAAAANGSSGSSASNSGAKNGRFGTVGDRSYAEADAAFAVLDESAARAGVGSVGGVRGGSER